MECKCASEVRLAADLRVRLWKWGMVANYDIISFNSADTFDLKHKISSLSMSLRMERAGGEGRGMIRK